MKNKGILLFLIIFLVVVAAAGVFVYWQKHSQEQEQEAQATESASLGSEIYDSAQNPVKDKLPETNPFENAKTNPFAE